MHRDIINRKAMFSPVLKPYLILLYLLLVSVQSFAANEITAARVWPAQEYTRIAIEANGPIKHQLIILKNPERLVLDIEDADLNSVLKSLPDRILSSDPYIKQVRAAKFKNNSVRIAIDLKTEIKPNVFALPPAGDYKHRLVIDIYPIHDDLMTMLDKKNNQDKLDNMINTTDDHAVEQAQEQVVEPIIEPLPAEVKNTDEPLVELPIPEPVITKETAKPSKTNKDDIRVITIAIDAGHGGEDPGARGASGSREKDITLTIAKKLKNQIDAEPNMRAVLTRDGDYFIPLNGRVSKARKLKADLFISIHADAFTNPAARGSSVFALSEKGATSASARFLAKKENESDLIGGVSLEYKDPLLVKTLLDLSQTATINDSLKLAKSVLTRIGEINTLHKNHVEQAGFAVLKSHDIPSILVETAFISNPAEEKRLNDDAYQDKLVDAILGGVRKYFASNPALAKTKGAKE